MKKGILYLVPTPIGNLKDMTYRGVEVLKTVDLIAAEDTRTSKVLLNHYEIKNKLISYHKFNESKQTKSLLQNLNQGKDVAIITDAGTPGISDPASLIVKAAIEQDIRVCCLPGATALIPALAASGLDTEIFTFAGFLPTQKKQRNQLLTELSDLPHTIVLYDSPHKIQKTIIELSEYFTERSFVIVRELSKIFETFYRGIFEDLSILDSLALKGEFVIVIEGKKLCDVSDAEIISQLQKYKELYQTTTELVQKVTVITGAKRNRVYNLAHKK